MVTVSDLRKLLEGLEDNTLLIVAHDPEGNSFGRLHAVERSQENPDEEHLEASDGVAPFLVGDAGVLIFWPAS